MLHQDPAKSFRISLKNATKKPGIPRSGGLGGWSAEDAAAPDAVALVLAPP